MTEWHILEIQMPVGAFCAFSGSFRPVRYFAPFLVHAVIFESLSQSREVFVENSQVFIRLRCQVSPSPGTGEGDA